MTELMKADVFFFISSIGVIVATVALMVAAYFVAAAAQEVRRLARRLRHEAEAATAPVRMLSRFVSVFSSELAYRWKRKHGGRQH